MATLGSIGVITASGIGIVHAMPSAASGAQTLPPLATATPIPFGGNVVAPPQIGAPVYTPDQEEAIASQAALDIPGTVASAQSIFGATYAGMWVDNSAATSVLHIVYSGPPNLDMVAQFRTSLSATVSATTDVSNATYSYEQLQTFQETLVNYAEKNFVAPANSPANPIMYSIDPIDNAVKVTLAHGDSQFLAPLQSLIPADAIRIEWNDNPSSNANGPGWTPGNNIDTFPPYKGGLITENAAHNSFCTTGFLLVANGDYKGLVAGHCYPQGGEVYSGDNVPMGLGGAAWSYGSGGDYDVMNLYKQQNATEGTFDAETNSSLNYAFIDDVTGRESNAQQGIGLEVCTAGWATNQVTCGSLDTGAGTIREYDGHFVGNLACGFFNLSHGDSGGPAYVPYPGNAGHAAGDNVAIQPFDNCYSTIDSALQGITAHYGPPAYVVGANGARY